jgi:YHS domain-containing protein
MTRRVKTARWNSIVIKQSEDAVIIATLREAARACIIATWLPLEPDQNISRSESQVMRRITTALFIVMMLAGAVATGAAADTPQKKAVTNKECPVSGGPVAEKYRTEYKGQYVYVCCEGCLNEFNKDPEKFIAKMSQEDKEAVQANTTCPVMGTPVDAKISVENEGRKVYFCCADCVAKYKKDHPGAK